MADRNKDLLSRFADLSEEVVQRLADAPGADRVLQGLKTLGDKVDEIQRRTKGYEEIERRLSALEKRLDAMAKPPRTTGSAGASAKPRGSTPKKT